MSSGQTVNKTTPWLRLALTMAPVVLAATYHAGRSRSADTSVGNHTLIQGLQCNYVMAPSRATGHSGWGVFALREHSPGDTVLYGDLQLPIPDVLPQKEAGIAHLLHNYSWSPSVARSEGTVVQVMNPGQGMLLNSDSVHFNVIPSRPLEAQRPIAGASRFNSPGAGASTYYHGRRQYAYRDISPGDELLISYGAAWARKLSSQTKDFYRQPVNFLRQHGICIDHIRPGQTKDPLRQYGAFATRTLPLDTIIAPLPIIAIDRKSLWMESTRSQQLILNYCFGHPKSSMLLYPYSMVSNYVNHGDEPNAQVRWSSVSRNLEKTRGMSPSALIEGSHWGMVLELVATREIAEGEEILIDYGPVWRQAWQDHVDRFVGITENGYEYPPGDSDGDNHGFFRTIDEAPYPDNLQTSCYYRYSDARPTREDATTTRDDYVFRQNHLLRIRPCRILERHIPTSSPHAFLYTVEMLNSHGPMGNPAEMIPEGQRHKVYSVPPTVITLVGKPYSSDQHLPGVFRHEMGLPDGLYPEEWIDLA